MKEKAWSMICLRMKHEKSIPAGHPAMHAPAGRVCLRAKRYTSGAPRNACPLRGGRASREKVWFDEAWEDYLYWQSQDKKTLKRVNQLLKDIEREPFSGIGKPEPLKGELSGFWSRRIDEVNRLVYRIRENVVEILPCRGHYDE